MSLAEFLLAHAGAARDKLAASPALEATLASLLDAGRAAWPQISVAPERFLRHLAERLPPDGDPVEALRATQAADLYLACGCAHGDPASLAELERHHVSRISAPPPSSDAAPIAPEELRQMLRARLLVGADGEPPRIASYTGRGPLAVWLRVAVARLVVDLRRAAKPGDPLERHAELQAAGPDPEMAFLKARYGREFEEAFEGSLAALSPREGSVLRLYFLEGMTANGIAQLYGVAGRTVQRWVADIRQKVLAETHRLLAERLRLSEAEMGSIYNLVRSQIAVNLPDRLKE